MKTTDENGKELTNKTSVPLGKKEKDKKVLGRTGEVSNEKKETEGLGKEKSLGNVAGLHMDLNDKNRKEGKEPGKEGDITGESKSIHVEDWENDPFASKGQEDDVRAEFALRKNKNPGNRKGEETTETGSKGRTTESGPDSTKYNSEDESGESGV